MPKLDLGQVLFHPPPLLRSLSYILLYILPSYLSIKINDVFILSSSLQIKRTTGWAHQPLQRLRFIRDNVLVEAETEPSNGVYGLNDGIIRRYKVKMATKPEIKGVL